MADDAADARDDSAFALPSRYPPLAHVTGFYDKATFNKDGSATVVFKVPSEHRAGVVDLAGQDGKALNITICETSLPPEMEELARVVGLVED